jgi:DNA-binding FrmR family transcriptional regulator
MSIEEHQIYNEKKTNIIHRLNRIEGQIRGIKKMMEDERDCSSILEQISSVRSSLDSVGLIFISCVLYNKIKTAIDENKPADLIITESMKPFLKSNFEIKDS